MILGARQVGKTMLAQALIKDVGKPATVFDLEHRQDLARLEDPELALQDLRGVVVLDEIQRRPELFPTLRVLADRPRRRDFLSTSTRWPNRHHHRNLNQSPGIDPRIRS